MTGSFFGTISKGNHSFQVSIVSVNRKFFDLQLHAPDFLTSWNAPLRLLIQKVASRGAITVRIHRLDTSQIKEDLRKKKILLEGVAQDLGYAPQEISFSLLLSTPYVQSSIEEILFCQSVSEQWQILIDGWDSERIKEGNKITSELLERIFRIEKLTRQVEKEQKEEIPLKAGQIARCAERYLSPGYTQEQFLSAAIELVAKAEPAEEVQRIFFHAERFKAALAKEPMCGKLLDFIAQELQREVTTLGAKVIGVEIVALIIEIKCEIEKIKEQVQNLV